MFGFTLNEHQSITVSFASVLLSGSEAVLPKIGTCSSLEYYCNTRKCSTNFIKELQKDPEGDIR